MVERKAFLAKSKHQYCSAQRGENDCTTHDKINEDYYEHPSLSHFTDEL